MPLRRTGVPVNLRPGREADAVSGRVEYADVDCSQVGGSWVRASFWLWVYQPTRTAPIEYYYVRWVVGVPTIGTTVCTYLT